MNLLRIGKVFGAFFLVLFACSYASAQTTEGESIVPLKVSESGRDLVREDGTPFFWLGDTAWALFCKLDREEALEYLNDRKDKGFTVIQAVFAWDLFNGNAYGERPFLNDDFRELNEAYWQHADYIIETAERLGLYMAILPAWATFYTEKNFSGEQQAKFPLTYDTQVALDYGRSLGTRYGDRKNIIWVLGGDVWGRKDAIYDALAAGLTETYADGDPDRILMTFHPKGGTFRPPATSTSEFYHNKEWLDFNMIQSGHRRGNKNYERIAVDYDQLPVKPTLESEPCYEQHPILHKFENGVFTAWDLRQRGYWSVFAGGFGFTYGANGVWQMDKPGRIGKETHHNFFWYDALDYEGAGQMIHLRKLIESRSSVHVQRIPDQTMVISDQGMHEDRIQCTRAENHAWLMVYTTNGSSFTLDASRIPAKKIRMWWYSPRNGKLYTGEGNVTTRPFAVVRNRSKTIVFHPPGDVSAGNDWVLVLDDAVTPFPPPGAN